MSSAHPNATRNRIIRDVLGVIDDPGAIHPAYAAHVRDRLLRSLGTAVEEDADERAGAAQPTAALAATSEQEPPVPPAAL
jgi:hypothetical protein